MTLIVFMFATLFGGRQVLCAREPSRRNAYKVRPSTGPSAVTEEVAMQFKSVEDVCKTFSVPLVNCSCKLFTVNGSDMFPDLCAIRQYLNKTTVKLVYYADLSRTYASVALIASITGLIGNFAVMWIAYRNQKNISKYKSLIAQLALADLLFAILQLTMTIPLFWTNKWLYGEIMCKALRGGSLLGGLVSIGYILLIALERYYGIIYVLEKKSSSFEVNFLGVTNILIAIATVIPYMVVLRVDKDTGLCGEQWPNKHRDSQIYNLLLIIFYFAIPAAITLVLYTKVVRYLRRQAEKIQTSVVEAEKRKRLAENRRIMWIVISMLIAFVICVLPNRVVWIYFDAVKYKMSRGVYFALSYVALITYPFYVAVNPIIYSMIDKKWQKDILQLFSFNKRKPRSRSSASKQKTDQSYMYSNKHYGGVLDHWKERKNVKSRNMSVDHGTHLLSYHPQQLTLPSTRINNALDSTEVFIS